LLTALSRSDEIWWSIRSARRTEQRSAGPVRRILFAWAPRSRALARREIADLRPGFWQQGQSNNLTLLQSAPCSPGT
jgi:hypothetical protein